MLDFLFRIKFSVDPDVCFNSLLQTLHFMQSGLYSKANTFFFFVMKLVKAGIDSAT